MLKIRIKARRSRSNKPPQKILPRSPGAKETQGVMREGGWRCPSICLPSHGMLSTPRRLANHCSRNAWQQKHTSQMLKIKGPNVVKSSNMLLLSFVFSSKPQLNMTHKSTSISTSLPREDLIHQWSEYPR